MMRCCGSGYDRFIEWITEDVSELATAAEMKRRGEGAVLLVNRMHASGLTVGGG
ncbi:hypothetical protein IFT66_14665 [Rhizobium sp. CFBP 13726]|uniref:hypothetical protein n=1 Tax=Rhizobium sp. CFBP 13726 TaxID=2775296 RepID=UPI00178738C0|nr:hypothetical protein [Rhizobium sp. CFBP 13726]MBD8652328.1 hypothetical protein [Rhizobium sp. CFBP 13726]